MGLNIDKKKIGLFVIAFAGSFLILLVLMFFMYPVVNPEAAIDEEEPVTMNETEKEKPVEAGIINMNSEVIPDSVSQTPGNSEGIQAREEPVKKMTGIYEVKIDSLKQVIEKLKEEHESEIAKLKSVKQDERLVETAKTLLSMDEEDLAPIVNSLEDNELLKLYEHSAGMQRQKLLRTLDPQKASEILKTVM